MEGRNLADRDNGKPMGMNLVRLIGFSLASADRFRRSLGCCPDGLWDLDESGEKCPQAGAPLFEEGQVSGGFRGGLDIQVGKFLEVGKDRALAGDPRFHLGDRPLHRLAAELGFAFQHRADERGLRFVALADERLRLLGDRADAGEQIHQRGVDGAPDLAGRAAQFEPMPEPPRRAGNDGECLPQRGELPFPAAGIGVHPLASFAIGSAQDFVS